MRQVYLPNLKKISIHNFTLYPNGMDFHYDFVNGVNLIMGGNGMGKTTFVNIIKYAIIGNYKKANDLTRTYQNRKIENRTTHPKDFFKKRMNNDIPSFGNPTVTIEFEINNKCFIVNRGLEDLILNSVIIKDNSNTRKLEGQTIKQHLYEEKDAVEKVEYLNYIFEEEISETSGIFFDDLIFFVNSILFFGENHKTVLWDINENGDDVQSELFNKYFNNPEFDLRRKEALRQAKYFNSLSRHRSEDIRAIKKVLDKIEQNKINKNEKSIKSQIFTLKNEINIRS